MRSCPPKHGTYAISEHTGTCVTFLLELTLGKGVRNPNDGNNTLVISGPKPLHFFIFWQPCHTCTRGATNPTRRVCTSYLYDLPHAHRAAHLRLFRVLPLRDNITSPKLPFALGLSMTVPLLACVLPLSRRCSAMPRPWPAERSQTERPYTSFKGQRRLLPLSAVPQA